MSHATEHDMKLKLTRYRQLAFEMRERRPAYTVTIVPIIVKALGGVMKKTMNDLTKLLTKQELVVKTGAEMQKTIQMDSETLLRKVFSGLVQSNTKENRPFSGYGRCYVLWPLKSHNAFVFYPGNLIMPLIIQ